MRSLLKVLTTVALSVLVTMSLLVGHMMYESNQYVPPPSIKSEIASTVSVYMDDGYCSGWVLKGTHEVVTAAHCAEGGDITQTMMVDFGDGTKHPFHIEKIGDANFSQGPDIMTLTTSDATVPWPVGMAVCTFKPYYGETLTLLGGPLGYEKTATIGTVSHPDRNLDDNVNGPYGHFIQFSDTVSPGNSGGPAVDTATGCVMGLAEMDQVKMVNGVPFFLAFLTPASELADLK